MQSEFLVTDVMYPKMVGGYNRKSMFVDEMDPEELGMSSGANEFDDRVFGNTVNEGYIPAFLEDYDHNHVSGKGDESFEGMIFMSNRQTKKECFNRELFGLPISQAAVVKRVKPGMKLFLFEYERRQLYGVFEATSCGALNIERDAFKTSGGSFPAQVRIKTVWECNPVSEEDFKNAIYKNYFTPKKFHFYLSQEQVLELIRLFSSRRIESQDLEAPDRFGSNEDLREKLDRQHQATMFLQEVRNNMSAMQSSFTNVEEDEMLFPEDCCDGQGMRDSMDSQQRLALYSSEQPNFSTSFERRHVMQSAQERNVSSNCEQRFALHCAQQCNHPGSCEQRVALNSSQELSVFSGAEQIHALHSAQKPIFSGSLEQGLAMYSVQQPNVSSSVDITNSAFQPSYMRGYPNSEENDLVAGNAFTNRIKMSDEIANTNGRDFFVPSNYRHYESLHFNESGGPHVPLSLKPMPGIHSMPIDERLWFERQELSQAPLNKSPVNDNNGSLFSHMDIFLGDAPSQVMEQPEGPVIRPKPSTAAVSSFRSDNSSPKKGSVFTRLSRVPQKDVPNDRGHEDLLRHSRVAKSDVQQYPQKLLRSSGKKTDILGEAHDRRMDIGVRDPQIFNDGIPINYKKRSKVSNARKELNIQDETQSKSVVDSLDSEDTDEQSVDDGMKINFKRRSETYKAIKESSLQVESQNKSNDGEPNLHRQKRRKLIRPNFNNHMVAQANVLPVLVPESVEKCHIESKILTGPEKDPCTNSTVNASVDVAEAAEKCPVESRALIQLENDSITNVVGLLDSGPSTNLIVNRSVQVAEAEENCSRKCPTETEHLKKSENDAEPKSTAESKILVQPEKNDVSTNTIAENSAAGSVDSLSLTVQEIPVVNKM